MSDGRRPTLVGKRRVISRRILEIPVWVIFNNYDIESDTNSVNVFPALDAEGSRSRILADPALGVSSKKNWYRTWGLT